MVLVQTSLWIAHFTSLPEVDFNKNYQIAEGYLHSLQDVFKWAPKITSNAMYMQKYHEVNNGSSWSPSNRTIKV